MSTWLYAAAWWGWRIDELVILLMLASWFFGIACGILGHNWIHRRLA